MNPVTLHAPTDLGHPVADHDLLGVSTGYMEDQRGDWPALIRLAAATTPRAVELSALSAPELEPLLKFLEATRSQLPFVYVSVHGPSKGWTLGEGRLAAALRRLPAQVESVILHPDVLSDLKPLRALGGLVVIENLDHRPSTGRTPEELAPFFEELPEAGFCFDIAHVSAIDPTMELGHRLLDSFGSRLRQLHVSSFVRQGARHIPLAREDLTRFTPLFERCKGVPWILEAPLELT